MVSKILILWIVIYPLDNAIQWAFGQRDIAGSKVIVSEAVNG